MLRNHRRTALTAAALIATTTLLTACQGGATEGTKVSASSGTSASPDAKEASGKQVSEGDTEASGGGKADTATGGTSGGGKVSGTWFGTVSYLAPGKYTVSDLEDTQQAFFTSNDTDIEGAGKICGDAAGQAATRCTEDELEAAAKDGVSATVKLKDGIAVSVVEDHPGTGGGGDDSDVDKTSGLRSGKLAHLAPGKYTVVNDEGEYAFFTTDRTVINGAGWICGDREDIKQCTEGELEAAAKKGVGVVVKIDRGVAVTIDENHN